jgi:hypothetical protein
MSGMSGMPPPQMSGMPPPQMSGMPPPQMSGMPPQMSGMPPPQMSGMPPPQMSGMPPPQMPPQAMPDLTGAIRLGGPPAPGSEPALKKPRVEESSAAPAVPPPQTTTGGLLNEADFAASNRGSIKIHIQLPVDDSNAAWKLDGQTITMDLPEGVKTMCKDLKGMLSSNLLGGIPLGKFQLKAKAGFMKDTQTLAAVNVGSGGILELSVKKRGGKR